MSITFTKLFSSITASTIWCESSNTKVVWITMLAMADRHGRVLASMPGLARIAGVPETECQVALDVFLSPDRHSRTKDHEGRRINEIDGGWELLNYSKFRDMRDEESLKDAKRKWIRNRRAIEKQATINIKANQVIVNDSDVD